jgi:hydrogenase expression/formation protein HypE
MNETRNLECPLPLEKYDIVQMSHGSGGRIMDELIRELYQKHFDNPYLRKMEDSATLAIAGKRIAFSTDSYVVQPIFFPGGNIGDLAVNGTINDLCMSGAKPVYLSVAFILEEGLALSELEQIVQTMARAARQADVQIVTGDTKVVDRGKADKLFINTSGIGVIEHDFHIDPQHLAPGDKIIVSGPVGRHGLAVLAERNGLQLGDITSDTTSLHHLTQALITACGADVHALRDPTRGGVAAALHELARASSVELRIFEEQIPVPQAVANGCGLLGLEPLHLANEGIFIAIVSAARAFTALQTLRLFSQGAKAAIIGEVTGGQAGRVCIQTSLGAWRLLQWPAGELLPRIC